MLSARLFQTGLVRHQHPAGSAHLYHSRRRHGGGSVLARTLRVASPMVGHAAGLAEHRRSLEPPACRHDRVNARLAANPQPVFLSHRLSTHPARERLGG
jgi:hypothetical protein